MSSTTLSTQEFSRNADAAARAAQEGPVFITDRGRTVHVLLNFSDYQRLVKEHRNMAELLSIPEIAAEVDFDPARSKETVTPTNFA
jgi:PHD/YefM family antitoxin component YafN of YafNO toxin-antitoxin module